MTEDEMRISDWSSDLCSSELVPIFGVCHGHQAIGQHYGGRIVRAPQPMHGKLSQVSHQGRGVFAGLPAPLTATRYHSLTIDPASFPHDHLEVTATAEDGVIMGLQPRTLPLYGVQFHQIGRAHV